MQSRPDSKVKFTVKHTFIEVADETTASRSGGRTRAMTDSQIASSKHHWPQNHDISDTSTVATLESAEEQSPFHSDMPIAHIPTNGSNDDAAFGPEKTGDWFPDQQLMWPSPYPAAPGWWGSSMGGYDSQGAYPDWMQWQQQCVPPMECYAAPDAGMIPMPYGVAPSLEAATATASSPAAASPPADAAGKTTVMLRNLPNNYTRELLLDLLQREGFGGTFDFVYLPIDFKSQAGLGYAFVNFTTPADATRCWPVFEGFTNWSMPSSKVCSVTWGNPLQGLSAHVERYRDSPVMHQSVPDEWKPVLFVDRVRVPFPPPTKPIKLPKLRVRGEK